MEQTKADGTMVLYGASGHAKVIVDTLEVIGKKIDWIVDDNDEVKELLGYEVKRNEGRYDAAIVSIGNCQIRKRVVESLDVNSWETAIHPSAVISPHASVGEGTVIMAGALVNSCAIVGKHNIINTGASVDHDVKLGDFVHIAPHATVTGSVVIGDGTWIGAGTVIRQGITIGRNCMIGAGSVVVKDIPDNVTAFGCPCRVMKYDKDMKINKVNIGGVISIPAPVMLHNVI